VSTIGDWIKQNTVDKGDKGVGDTVKRVVDKVGIKECGGCAKRREILNQSLPYRRGK
jgi:hypothetical protein